MAAVDVDGVVLLLTVTVFEDGSPAVGDWLVHCFPLVAFGAGVCGAVLVEAWRGDLSLLLYLWQRPVELLSRAEASSSCSRLRLLAAESYALVLREEQDGLETHRLALESSVGDVVVRGRVLHHVVDTALALVGVEYLLDPSPR